MRYLSTRGHAEPHTFSSAIDAGLAPDGGLFVPERFPPCSLADFAAPDTHAAVAAQLLQEFFAGDRLADSLAEICRDALNFPLPLRALAGGGPSRWVLELFHGPTAAFKDVGARFLAACLQRQPRDPGRPLTILVATSGDTGGAVAAAFHGRPDVEVVILFPKGQVSPRQQKQLTCWGGNVRSFAVHGAFDDCQRLVKAAFQDPLLARRYRLSSANSINIGRLLPQMVYYATALLQLDREHTAAPGFVIPAGNLGNALACLWAKRMGLPIGPVILATNANRTLADYVQAGRWQPRPSVATLASAMDVGDPSNFERLRVLVAEQPALGAELGACAVSDAEIEAQIVHEFREHGDIICPHTATGMRAYARLSAADKAARHWVLVATADAAKFETIVEPLIGTPVPVPAPLAQLLKLPSQVTEIGADFAEFRDAL